MPTQRKPNIIFLMTDQQRWDCMGRFNPYIKTPSIDKLAANGIIFSQGVCQCPMCVPSRNSMMFGMYPSQIGVRTNAGGIFDETRLPALPLPQLMKDNGYFTAGFGKTHWNNGLFTDKPSKRGFDIRAEGQSSKSSCYEYGAVMMDDEGQDAEGLKAYGQETHGWGGGEENYLGYMGCTSKLPKEHHRDGFIFKKCMEFLNGPLPENQPLFLYLSFIKPHAGFNVPPEYEAQYRLEDIPDLEAPPWLEEPDTHVRAVSAVSDALRRRHEELKAHWQELTPEQRRRTTLRYWANCTFLDDFIGQAVKRMGQRGLLDNALIIFTSDHGDMMGERDHRFSKYCMYDGSVRVPMVLSGSLIPPEKKGIVDSRPAELVDWIPTICDAAGIVPDPRLPGLSLLSDRVRKGAFSEFHGGGPENPQPAPCWMWRNAHYKLILFREGTVLEDTPLKGELYDLKKDPHEWYNQYYNPEYAEIRFRMMEELLSHVATAYAKGPAFGDKLGLEKITGK